jgi:uncharacterized protein (TIGR00255 family)
MLRSMTGFGKASREFGGAMISAEINSVNHRFVDISLRIPSAWISLEAEVKQNIRRQLDRGKINAIINRRREASSGQTVQLDREVARRYIEAAGVLAGMLGSRETLSLNTLARLEGVFYYEEDEEDLDAVRPVLEQVVNEALRQMNAMREAEGRALEEDIRQRIGFMRDALAAVEARLPELNALYEERLRARINELKTEVAVTEERIALEVALLAEKADVTEEVVRFKTHLDHMIELLGSEEPVGRRLDFLSQEIGREINTLGVKTRDTDVTKEVIRLKSELEKIREQIQNIE